MCKDTVYLTGGSLL